MDTLTHGLSGALLGRAFSSKAMNVKPKVFLLVGFVAAIFPDFDIISGFLPGDASLLYHRGITHSLILMPLWAALIAYLMALMFKHRILFEKNWLVEYVGYGEKKETASVKVLFKELYLLTMLSILIHICGDLITQFGTMIFAPFSTMRVEFGSVFIIDLWFTSILVVGLLASSIGKHYKPLIAGIFLVLWCGYIGYTNYEKLEAEKIGWAYAKKQNIKSSDIVMYSSPRPVSAKNWTVSILDKKTDTYYVADFSLLDEKMIYSSTVDLNYIQKLNNQFPSYKEASWKPIKRWGDTPEEEVLAHRIWEDPLFANYRWFYAIPTFDFMVKTDFETCGYFKDLRFSSAGRERGMPFTFGICYTRNGEKYKVEFNNNRTLKRQ